MRTRIAGLTVIALLALAYPAAAQSGPKDYSKNSVTGEFAPVREAEVRTSSLAGTTSPRRQAATGDDPWPELVAGFLAGCLVAGAAAVIAGRSRRTRIAV